ncbi:MAG: MMPL family transporter, partial [Thermoplasmata archaeon]
AEAIGFGALMEGTIPVIIAIGAGLTFGILLVYILSMMLTPALCLIVNYKKSFEFKSWESFASFPQEHSKKILAFTIFLVLISIIFFQPRVSYNADFLSMAPRDEPSILKLEEYSRNMGGGQMGMVKLTGQLNQFDTLKIMDHVNLKINDVDNTMSFCIVDIMKIIRVPSNITVPNSNLAVETRELSFWQAISQTVIASSPTTQQALLDIFYKSIPAETKLMIMNKKEDATLIYVFMPMMDIEKTKAAVDEVNSIVSSEANIPGGSIKPLTGVASLQIAINDLMVATHTKIMILSLVLVCITLAIAFRDIKAGIITTVPVLLVVALEPLTLYIIGISLNVITVMVVSIVIGTGVDYAIQITQRFRQEGETLRALRIAVQYSGVSFVEVTATMLGGFGTAWLVVMAIPSIQEFLLLMMLLLIYSAFMALLFLPALYTFLINYGFLEKKKPVEELSSLTSISGTASGTKSIISARKED